MTMLFHTAFAAGSMSHLEGAQLTVSTSYGRLAGRYGMSLWATPTFKNIPASDEIYYRAAFNCSYASSTNELRFRNFTTTHCHLNMNGPAGYITFTPATGAAVNSALGVIRVEQWFLLEVHCKIHDTLGIFEVKVDGETVISVVGTAPVPCDTRSGATTTIDNVYWYGFGKITDIAICDTLGAVNNTWIGNGYGSCIVPNADGDSSQFTGSDADKVNNWNLVDEVPWSTTDYVQDNVVGEKDLYNMTSPGLAANEYCNCITTRAIAKLDQEGDGGLQMGIKTATEAWAAASPLPSDSWKTLSQLNEVDPDDSLAWDGTKLDAIQAGVKVAT